MKAAMDFVIHAFGGAVADDVYADAECVVVRIVPPDTVSFLVVETIAKGKVVEDVTIAADGDFMVVRVHATKDAALLAENDKARKAHRLKMFMLDAEVPMGIKDTVDRVGQSLCHDLPVDASCAFTFESTAVLFRMVAPMAKGAKLSEADLGYVNQKVAPHGGTVDVFSRAGRLFVRCTVPVTTRKRKRN